MTRLLRFAGAALLALIPATVGAQAAHSWSDITPPLASQFGQVTDIVVHPLEGGRLVAAVRDPSGAELRASRDGGLTWGAFVTLPAPDLVAIDRLFVHKGRPGTLILQEGGEHATCGMLTFFDTRKGGRTFRSDDFGATWVLLAAQQSQDIAISPFASDPLDTDRIFATERTFELRRGASCLGADPPRDVSVRQSVDGGKTWTPAGDGLPAFRAIFGRFLLDAPDGPTAAAHGRLFFTAADGVYVSRDSAKSWSLFGQVTWVRQDPSRAEVLYTLSNQPLDFVTRLGQVLRSDDAGSTWRPIFEVQNRSPGGGIRPMITVDPVRSRRIWLTGLEAGVYFSEDAGEHWSLEGFREDGRFGVDLSAIVTRITLNPADAGVAYLAWKGRLYRGSPGKRRQPVAEEFRYLGDRYWVSAAPGETLSQDYRANQAVRTGERFGLWGSDSAPAGAARICRFQGNPARGQHSRFLTTEGGECESLKRDPAWVLEGEGEHFAMQPGIGGACASGLVSVKRFVSTTGAFTNHRYVASAAALAEMRASNWIEEGTAMCARPLGSDE